MAVLYSLHHIKAVNNYKDNTTKQETALVNIVRNEKFGSDLQYVELLTFRTDDIANIEK